MDDLSKDPIITFYLKMSESTEYETKLPVFSETLLRLALTQILGKFKPLELSEVQLYRKLLLFYYSERYDSVQDLLEIMHCFNEADQNEYFAQYHDVMYEWSRYSCNQLKVYLYKEAFTELMFEWTRRYLHVFGHVNNDLLNMQALEVQQFLWQHDKYLKSWLRSFKSVLPSRQSNDTDNLAHITADDLKISKIFSDIKSKINPMVCEEVSNKPLCQDNDKKPPKKKLKKEQIEMLDIQIVKEDTQLCDEIELREEVEQVEETEIREEFEQVEETEQEFNDEELFEDNNSVQNYVADDIQNECYVDDDEKTYEQYTDEEEKIDQNGDDVIEIVDVIDSEESENSQSTSEEPKVMEEQTEDTNRSRIISLEMALKYLSDLQAYAVVNGHFNAFGKLDEVDTIFRSDTKK